MDHSTIAGNQTVIEVSLLPYLTGDGIGLRLKRDIGKAESGSDASSAYVIEGAGPYAHIMKGCLTADDPRTFRDLFVLVQPDQYAVTPTELSPITNVQVDGLWQSAWARIKGGAADDFPAVFPQQIDEKGRLIPFRSLFHCRHKDRFVHPLCPDCGGALTLCRDDALLTAAGLQAYGKSLDRYLFCSGCRASKGASVFYTRAGDAGPDADVRSCAQLIEGFSALLSKEALAKDLPCVGCDQASDCYGPQTLVHQRMHPLMFYPFFMLMQPAATMNALEFLDLLSGAAFDRVARRLSQQKKPGRLRCLRGMEKSLSTGSGLLFTGDKRFLEVLYLKLTFLEELSALVLQTNGPSPEPVAGMSLESLWVRLPAGTARLPWFWNFSLGLIDPVGRPAHAVARDVLPMAHARHFLGSAWCHALLVDDQQDMTTVQAAVDKLLLVADGLAHFEISAAQEIDPVFAPSHLLRTTESLAIDPRWEEAWRQALLLGLGVPQAGIRADEQWSADHFKHQLNIIKESVHNLLFQAPEPVPAVDAAAPCRAVPGEVASAFADPKIAGILRAILDEWSQPQAVQPNGTTMAAEETRIQSNAPAHPNADGDFEETIILDSAPVQPQTPSDPRPAPPAPGETVLMGAPSKEKGPPAWPREDAQATLIISPGQVPAAPPPEGSGQTAAAPGKPSIAAALQRTVMMGGPPKGKTPPKWSEDDMQPTVIISPGQGPGDPSPLDDAAVNQASSEDDLEKTVVLDAQRQTGAGRPPDPAPAKPPRPESSDELEETLILSPDKSKERTPGK